MSEEWLEGARVVGISSGASAPEELVQRLVDFFRARGTEDISEFEVLREDVRFMLPKVIRQASAGAPARVEVLRGSSGPRSDGHAGHPCPAYRASPSSGVLDRSHARSSSPCSSSRGGGRRISGRSPSSRSGGAGSG